jgi:hypothetical protein
VVVGGGVVGGGFDPVKGRFSTEMFPTPTVDVPVPIALHISTFTVPPARFPSVPDEEASPEVCV